MKETIPEICPGVQPPRLRRAGFTLVEILIVLAIVVGLATIAFPAYQIYINKARVTVSIDTLGKLRKNMEEYHVQYSGYPDSIDAGTGLDSQGRTVMDTAMLDDFKKNMFSLESYTPVGAEYLLTAKAKDSAHTLLKMTPTQIAIQGP